MRERVLLFGDAAFRPDGLERALVRAGFALAEAGPGAPAILPELALVAVPDDGAELERALATFRSESWMTVPLIVLLASTDRNGIARALSLGATDVLSSPVNLGELVARLESRLRVGAEMRRAASAGALQSTLLRAMEAIAVAGHPEEMLEILTGRIGSVLEAAHCACLAPSADRRYARLIAVHENPTLRNVAVDLFRYPEAVEAAISARTVYAPEVLRDRLFLTHLAQWPDSPEVHEVESAVAVPLMVGRSARAVLVVRTRRGEPPMTSDRVTLVEQLVNATGALVEREERRADLSRRQGLATGIDPLTRCGSLDALDRRLREELERARRYGSPVAFALLDVQALRDLNARLGEVAGDRLLAELGSILLQEVRGPDFVARYGSDEFAVLMPSTGQEGARTVLARIAARVANHPFDELGIPERPRLLTGLVAFPQEGVSRAEDLLAAAEAALLLSKAGAAPVGPLGSAA
jgi:diguanylate cyclase (GGDEF)-like protein